MGGNKGGGIFENWLKHFVILVFTQSFHAIFLVFIMKLLAGITVEQVKPDSWGENDGLLAIMTIVTMMALIKFEKLIKELFGIQDSKFMGGIGDNLAKSFATIKSGAALAKRTVEPFKETTAAKKRLNDLKTKRSAAQTKLDALGPDVSNASTTSAKASASENSSRENKHEFNPNKEEIQTKISNIEELAKALSDSGIGARSEDEKETTKKRKALEDEIAKYDEEAPKAEADYNNARLKSVLRAGSTMATGLVGMGATDNIGDAAIVANLMDAPLDMASDNVSKRVSYGNASKKLEANLQDAVEKATIDVSSKNPNLDKNSAEFKAKVDVQVIGQKNAKYQVDSEIPNSAIKTAKEEWVSMAKAPLKTGKAASGLKQSKTVNKEGLRYGSTKVDDL